MRLLGFLKERRPSPVALSSAALLLEEAERRGEYADGKLVVRVPDTNRAERELGYAIQRAYGAAVEVIQESAKHRRRA